MTADAVPLAMTSVSNDFDKQEAGNSYVASAVSQAMEARDLTRGLSTGNDPASMARDDVDSSDNLDGETCSRTPLTDQQNSPNSIEFPQIEAPSPKRAAGTDSPPQETSLDTLQLATNEFTKPEAVDITELENTTNPDCLGSSLLTTSGAAATVQPTTDIRASSGEPDVEIRRRPMTSSETADRETGSHVDGTDVTSRRRGGNVDVYAEKVWMESLATGIGKLTLSVLMRSRRRHFNPLMHKAAKMIT